MARNTRKTGRQTKRPERQLKPKTPVARPRATRGGLIALGLMLLAVAIYCALFSYNANDTGVLEPISSTRNADTHNYLGPPGAFLGSLLLTLLGAAAWLVPMVLIWISLMWLLVGRPTPVRVWVGGLLLIFASSSLLAIQPWVFQHWQERWNILGAGGAVGILLGGNGSEPLEPDRLNALLQRSLGTPLALLACVLVYAVALVLLSGVAPLRVLKALLKAPGQGLRHWRERRRARAEKRAELPEPEPDEAATVSRIKRSARRGARRRREEPSGIPQRVGKSAGKAGGDEFSFDDDLDSEPDPQSARPRRIIDSTKRAPARKEAKPAPRPAEGPDFPGYSVPAVELLATPPENQDTTSEAELLETQELLVETLGSFGVEVTPGDITRGPTVTRYEVYPARGLRVGRIASFDADLARATCAERVNILAPIPGKNTVGIEIANHSRTLVTLREILEDKEFSGRKKKIPIALGKDVYGRAVVGDLAEMPHLLVAGATGSGKSVCINSIISSILFRFSPDQLRFLLIDPKVVEMQLYNRLPHLIFPVITEPKKVILALRWVVNEMERRYRLLGRVGVRNLEGFNKRDRSRDPEPGPVASADDPMDEDALDHIERIGRALDGEDDDPEPTATSELDLFADPDEPIPDKLPYIVVIIDELADLMQTARPDVEGAIQRITQKARAAGIHLIVATQTPRAEVITGTIKANIPSRIAFAVSNKIDSRVILDTGGAEKLVGKGDLLYMDPRSGDLRRSQGCFVEDEEVEELVAHCYDQAKPKFVTRLEDAVADQQQEQSGSGDEIDEKDEEMLGKCVEVILAEGAASTSLLQRRLSLGYTRAARMMDLLEQKGYVGPQDGAKRREILIKAE